MFNDCISALTEPTGKQKEGLGRLIHTLCAAGVVSLIASHSWLADGNWVNLAKFAFLAAGTVVALFAGSVLSKG